MQVLTGQFEIAHAAWLWAILPTLLALGIIVWRFPRTLPPLSALWQSFGRRHYRHPAFEEISKLQQKTHAQVRYLSWFLKFVSYGFLLSLFCMTLSQPYRLGARLPAPERHRDIIFIVDTSLNMTLRDYLVDGKRTSRMTMLKRVLQHFITALHGNRIGLIVFSEHPYYYVPLTSDYALLQYQIRRLRSAVLTGRTSNISRALLYSLRWAKQDEKNNPGPAPVLVLISDANRSNRHIDPRAAAAYLARQHLRLHTIAIGAGSSAGAETDRLTLIYHPASFYLLQGIARAGNGKFFWAKNEASLQRALETINQAGLRKIHSSPQYLRKPLYMWPLLVALSWLTAWQFVPLLRRRH